MSDGGRTAFEVRRELPDDALLDRARRLVGFEKRFNRLAGQMRLLTDQRGVEQWARDNYGESEQLSAALADRYPLVLFHGDVGTGKTATAECSADALARQLEVEGHMLKLSTRVRGIGHVGEMSSLIGDAFDEATALAGRRRFVAMVIDEGDALAFNRGAERAHHEDKVGVNTLIQKIDDARELDGRLLIILCTNRFGALDPAIIRRAALIDTFNRPDAIERAQLFTQTFGTSTFDEATISRLVEGTGANENAPGFTFSDIQTKVVPAAVAKAYPERPLTGNDLLAAMAETEPSPVMDAGTD
jgi:AAA+ superfamily predicted ATPase